MTEINEAIAVSAPNKPDLQNLPEKKDEAQASKTTQLLELMSNEEFFHDEQKNAYVTFFNTDHYETWALGSDNFERWLSFKYWSTYGKAIHGAALNDAIATLKGQAIFNGKCHQVFTRVGHSDGKVYINLANTMWQTVEISETGWSIIEKSPIKFQSSKNMQPLPTPIAGRGNFSKIWEHINIPEISKILTTAWLIDSLIPWTAFPVLALTGLQGSGKSTTQERLRRLIDPSQPNLRNPPKNSDDIATAALNNWIVSYNNVSRLSNQNQDDFCCLSTGGGFARRQLYTTGEEFVADIKRPIIINGIGDIITRQDLLDRTVTIIIPSLDQHNRKQESDLDKAFESDYPIIFTGIIDLLVQALKIIPTINLTKKPRMASFAVLGKALEQILELPENSFESAYRQNYLENMRNTIDSSSVATAIIKLINSEIFYSGTYAQLYERLYLYKPNLPNWPTSPKGLANSIKRHAPALAVAGIDILFEDYSRNDGFHIEIKKSVTENNF